MANIKSFGSLYLNGEAVKPGVEYNNEDLAISDSFPRRKITWVKVNGLLIAGRCLCTNISWDQINEMGLVYGTPVTIDGQRYLCRLLKVGDQEGVSNEWDSALDATSEDDALWHWGGEFFWGQEVSANLVSPHAIRGYYSARFWHYLDATGQYVGVGFRPVLEPLPPEPLVSDNLLGTRLKVYLQKDCRTGTLTEYTDYDLVLQVPADGDQEQIPGTVQVGNNLLAIDRKAITYINIVSH